MRILLAWSEKGSEREGEKERAALSGDKAICTVFMKVLR